MQSDNETLKQTQQQPGANPAGAVKKRQAWERPALRRLAAAEAELKEGEGADSLKRSSVSG